jgi:hypothetical protein
MARIGCARVSTDDQTRHLPLDALREAGCIDIDEEHASPLVGILGIPY